MSTTNLTDFLRLSCDTRWQPCSQKVDTRYVGNLQPTKAVYGVYGEKSGEVTEKKTIASLKAEWGFTPKIT